MTIRVRRLHAWTGITAVLVLLASPAAAQYKPRPLNDPATGELFHIEASVGWWFPTADMSITSGGSGALSGIAGTTIDAKKDLGFEDTRQAQFSLTLRPATRHKFRAQVIPIGYTAQSTLRRDIVFNGQKYSVNLPVNSTFDWKAYRFNYEYDFIVRNRGFVGFIMEAKHTDVRVDLVAPGVTEFVHVRQPIPALGGVARVYVVPNISITGEVTGFLVPDSIDDRYRAHYVDVDIYGTVNFTNNIGVKGGYRSFDVGYHVDEDLGAFTLNGIYFGIVARY